MGKYGVTARLVWDGGKELYLPEEMGTPRPDQLQGSIGEKLSEVSGRICFDPKTELLTRGGWVRLDDLQRGIEVATFSRDTERMEFQEPTDYIQKTYHGKMYRVFSSKVSLFVTPDHEIFVTSLRGGAWILKKAVDLKGTGYKVLRHALYEGSDPEPIVIPDRVYQQPTNNKFGSRSVATRTIKGLLIDLHQLEAWAELLGYYISEGSLNFPKGSGATVAIYQKTRNTEQIIKSGEGCGIEVRVAHVDKRNDVAQLRVGGSFLAYYLRQFGRGSKKLRIPDYVFDWPIKLREIFLDAMMFGDGHTRWNGVRIYNTSSKRLADDVQRLIMSLGRPANINRSECETCTMYRVRETAHRESSVNHHKAVDKWVQYDGQVYCVSVPNRILITRRDDKIVLAGNCYDSCGTGRSSRDFHPHILGVGHFSVYEHPQITIEWKRGGARPGEMELLLSLINRPGLWIEMEERAYRLTYNPRVVLDWDSWSQTRTFPPSPFVKQILRYYAEQEWSQITPCPKRWDSELLAAVSGQVSLVEPKYPEEKWISIYMSGSRGFSHEQVRHGDRSAISQRSTRFVDESESPWIDHPLEQEFAFQSGQKILQVLGESVIEHSRTYYKQAVKVLEAWLIERGMDKLTARKQARGAARGKLGNALETQMIFSASVGQWHRMIKMRCHPAADAEIRAVYVQVLEEVLQKSRYAEDFKRWKLIPSTDGMGQCAVEQL